MEQTGTERNRQEQAGINRIRYKIIVMKFMSHIGNPEVKKNTTEKKRDGRKKKKKKISRSKNI